MPDGEHLSERASRNEAPHSPARRVQASVLAIDGVKDYMGSQMSLPTPHRFTVDEYHRMGEAGIFHEDDRVELIAGEIIEMAPIGSDHAWVVTRLTMLFARACGDLIVWSQNPVILSVEDEPQPDLVLVKPAPHLYRKTHPGPDEVLLVIEVADTSLPYDRNQKLPRYALAGIPEVWIVDLRGDRFLVFRSAKGRGYETQSVVSRDEQVSPLALPGLVIGPRDLR
jgi:Uma2 family endonuclease